MNSLLSNGDQSLSLGSDVDRGLLKQAAEIAGATEGDASDGYWGTRDSRLEIEDINSTVDAMLNNASGDHQAVSDFLSGENMDVTATAGNHYDANSHFLDLVTHPWDEDQRGAVNVIDWIGENADAPGYEGELAGRSATTLANLLINNEDLLSGRIPADDIPGTYTSLGQVNPHLTQSLALSMSPYLANFVDAPDSMLVNQHAGHIDEVSELSKLFKVLDSDPISAGIMHTASTQWQNNLAYQYGMDPDMTEAGFSAGQLNQASTEGFEDQMKVLVDNKYWENIVEYNLNSRDYDTVAGLLGSTPLIPVSVGIGTVSPIVKFEMFDIPNDPATLSENQWNDVYKEIQNTSQSDSIVLDYSAAEGYLHRNPEAANEAFSYNLPDGRELSYVGPDGRIDWNAVTENRGTFQKLIEELGLNSWDGRYDDGLSDNAIDQTIIPIPSDPALPPNP